MRVYYDKHGRYRGYSVPFWLVALKWLVIASIIAAPLYGLFSLLGIAHTSVGATIIVCWVIVWFAIFDRLKSSGRS